MDFKIHSRANLHSLGVIVETDGSIWKMQKRALFHYKKVKKGTPNLTSPLYDGASLHFMGGFFLRKKILKKNTSHHQRQHPEVALSFNLKKITPAVSYVPYFSQQGGRLLWRQVAS